MSTGRADSPDSPVNMVPGKYRGVAVSRADVGLDETQLAAHLLGKTAYRRTRFVVVHNHAGTAIVRIHRVADETLFAPITAIEVVAGPDDCTWVDDPNCDTAIPSALAATARSLAPGARAVVVEGLYQHVSFIVGPRPLRVVVREVVPPHPAKLLDQARRVLAMAEDLPPIELVPDLVDIADLVRERNAARYLLPCRGAGFDDAAADVSYLDERPPYADWTLIGPERSAQIHRAFYDRDAPEFIDICPDNRPPIAGPLLTKCSMIENDIRVTGGKVTIPWGSTLAHVRRALEALVDHEKPPWTPA